MKTKPSLSEYIQLKARANAIGETVLERLHAFEVVLQLEIDTLPASHMKRLMKLCGMRSDCLKAITRINVSAIIQKLPCSNPVS